MSCSHSKQGQKVPQLFILMFMLKQLVSQTCGKHFEVAVLPSYFLDVFFNLLIPKRCDSQRSSNIVMDGTYLKSSSSLL